MKIKIFFTVIVMFLFFAGATGVYAASVNLSWDAPGEGGTVEGYKIYWSTTKGSYNETSIVTVTGGKTSGTVTGLSDVKTYYFVVKAYNAAGSSPASNEISWSYSDSTPPYQVQGINVN
jgi:hypothetical protein